MEVRSLALVVALLAACGTTPGGGVEGSADASHQDAPSETAIDIAPDGPALDNECATNADCAAGWWCAGEAGCDAQWRCQPDTPCSAAPGFSACTCEGVYAALASGCPAQRYAYTDPVLPPRLLNTLCNPDAAGPVERADLVLRGAQWNEYDGLRVGAVLIDGATGTQEAAVFGFVENGAFEVTWFDTFDRDVFGYFVRLFFDVLPDLTCGPEDHVVEVFASNSFSQENPIVFEVVPALASRVSCP